MVTAVAYAPSRNGPCSSTVRLRRLCRSNICLGDTETEARNAKQLSCPACSATMHFATLTSRLTWGSTWHMLSLGLVSGDLSS
jgi:hypothetical protein